MSASGTVKSFNGSKGFGFIDCGSGTDVFIHIKDCIDGGQPAVGDTLTFDLEPSKSKPGQMQARNVKGGTAVKDQPGEDGGAAVPKSLGANSGVVKTYNADKGFGFIEATDGGPDIFLHVKQCVGGQPKQGDRVQFDVEPSINRPGQMVAKNVTGGSQPLPGEAGGTSGYGPVKGPESNMGCGGCSGCGGSMPMNGMAGGMCGGMGGCMPGMGMGCGMPCMGGMNQMGQMGQMGQMNQMGGQMMPQMNQMGGQMMPQMNQMGQMPQNQMGAQMGQMGQMGMPVGSGMDGCNGQMGQMPAAGQQMPAAGQQTPAAGQQMLENGMPVGGGMDASSGQTGQMPSAGQQMPANGEAGSMPVGGDMPAAAGATAPGPYTR